MRFPWLLLTLCAGSAAETSLAEEDLQTAADVYQVFYAPSQHRRGKMGDPKTICTSGWVKCVRVQDRWRVRSMEFNSYPAGEISESICKLTWLQELKMTRIKGPLPGCFRQLRMLRKLEIKNTPEMTGEIPEWIGELRQLERIVLLNVGLRGSLPRSFWSIRSLKHVEIWGLPGGGSYEEGWLKVDIPEEVGQLSQLSHLQLQNLQITSPLPASIGLLQQLEIMKMDNTQLPGTLPSSMGLLRNLRNVNLQKNEAKEIPAAVASMTELDSLSMPNVTGEMVPWSLLSRKYLQVYQPGGSGYGTRVLDMAQVLSVSDNNTQCIDAGVRSVLDNVLKGLWGESYESYMGEQLGCPCFWQGVSCIATDAGVRIYGLSIQSEKMVGILPSELGQMPELEFLDLRGQLRGMIPDAMGELRNLRLLDLSGNLLWGEIPASIFQLQEIVLLSLAGNQLQGGIAAMNSPQLQVLNISGNKLDGAFPAATAELPKLRYLDLRRNLFKQRIPQVWDRFSTLWELRLSGNMFDGAVPDSMLKLTQLRVLDLANNNLYVSLTPAWEKMSLLEVLDIHGTEIERGKFNGMPMGGDGSNCAPLLEDPCNFFHKSERIDLEKGLRMLWTEHFWRRQGYSAEQPFCSWSGVTCANVEGRPRVVKLVLEDALMAGEVSDHIADLQALKELRIRRHLSSGKLPQRLGRLQQLEVLELRGPYLGSLKSCDWLGTLKSLRVLILTGPFSVGKLWGDKLPTSLRFLSKLEVLDLTGDHIDMNFDDVMGLLQAVNLKQLRLSGNKLRGSLTAAIGVLSKLEVLALDGNNLGDSLPSALKYLTSLRELDLRSNKFRGRVPTGLRKLEHLTNLALSNNSFKGNFTAENCAPLDEDPCSLFPDAWVPEDQDEAWPFVIGASLLLSPVFYFDRSLKSVGVRAGALELAIPCSDKAGFANRRRLRNIGAFLEVGVLLLGFTTPATWSPLLAYILCLALLLGKLAISVGFHKFGTDREQHRIAPSLRPLDLLFPQGYSTYNLPSRELAAHSGLLLFLATGALITNETFKVLGGEAAMRQVVEPVQFVVFFLALARVQFASSHAPFDEQYEAKALLMRQVALAVEVFTSDPRWTRINERTLQLNWDQPADCQRSFREVELQDSSFEPATPQPKSRLPTAPVESNAEAALPQADSEQPTLAGESSKTPVSVTVGRTFSYGGPVSLTVQWQPRQPHEVWLLEMGPCVYGGPGGAMLDVVLVLLLLVLSFVALWSFSGPGYLWMSIMLMAAVWRLTLWNTLTWVRLPRQVATTLEWGYFTDGMMRIRSDAFGVLAPILAFTACWSAMTSSPYMSLMLPVPVFLTALQLRVQDRRAGFM